MCFRWFINLPHLFLRGVKRDKTRDQSISFGAPRTISFDLTSFQHMQEHSVGYGVQVLTRAW
ncbi:hypothetical protein BofuT4_uP161160.1 [Botrytis cinerea T4]|uniref:Uncharacterized protein n=1 Tax=Botryotinia fuckeliana (strain T4) TaxID=999810 RepID=G2YTR7_BOTF4|nr:hypothetical protein BofuT4_uP161160.1 [Botrytis cinerea T4]